MFGGWDRSHQQLSYQPLHSADTLAKKSGFKNGQQYFLTRAYLDPCDCGDEEISMMTKSFFSDAKAWHDQMIQVFVWN